MHLPSRIKDDERMIGAIPSLTSGMIVVQLLVLPQRSIGKAPVRIVEL